MIVAAKLVSVISELPATRWASGSNSATEATAPVTPSRPSSDETPSSATYQAGVRSLAAAPAATRPSDTARSAASASTSSRGSHRVSTRPRPRPATTPGTVYAATAAPTRSPVSRPRDSSMASQEIATAAIPSPIAEHA